MIQLRFLETVTKDNDESTSPPSESTIIDAHPIKQANKVSPRLPMVTSLVEFPPDRSEALRRHQATTRILKIAADQLMEPPTLHLLAFSAWATMGIASLEAILLCKEWPLWESLEGAKFVWWYSVQQLVPSIVWDSQDPIWIARSLGMDPSDVLRELSPKDPESATALLRVHFLSTIRFSVAGFMMIASIVRAAGVSASAFSLYEERIRLGREPPLPITDNESPGMVIRMCGRDSYTTEVSLQKMGVHIFPVFEIPERVQYLVWRHSEKLHRPIFWCVREGKYGAAYSWDRFPADQSIFIPTKLLVNPRNDDELLPVREEKPKLLILEADATNPHDPLALGNAALDLNLDDASQGFRRIQERFTLAHPSIPGQPKTFRTLRVYLGNSMEIARTGGGHAYTLRHRVRYAKEIDVLIDSRAPVLERILDWCRRVAGTDRRIFFQTSSQDYFRSLQKILRCYGYEIYDPLDLRTLWLSQTSTKRHVQEGKLDDEKVPIADSALNASSVDAHNAVPPSLLGILMEDPFLYDMWQDRGMSDIVSTFAFPSRDAQGNESTSSTDARSTDSKEATAKRKSEMLRQVVKMAKLPRLVHMPTTAETVNAVEALITAGEVDATHCCAILERHEGVAALEYIIEQKSDLVRGERHQEWIQETEYMEGGGDSTVPPQPSEEDQDAKNNRWAYSRRHRAGGGAGLQMICTSTIYDDLFRQVRMWARMGFTSAQIQKEMDFRFHEILDNSHEVQKDTLLDSAVDGSTPLTDIMEEGETVDSDGLDVESITKKSSEVPDADPHR